MPKTTTSKVPAPQEQHRASSQVTTRDVFSGCAYALRFSDEKQRLLVAEVLETIGAELGCDFKANQKSYLKLVGATRNEIENDD